ncbi:MAG: hypothetical protein GX673_05980 [Gammaproteobacteria bacterium]|nr:hypothetical protein [Gammaproteobacteria bacterium]
MRNDTDDNLDDVSSLPNGRIEPQLNTSATDIPTPLHPTRPAAPQRTKGVGVLSALTLAILCSSTAFGWWSIQRMQLLEQQLVATQNSFSKTSEAAAGRIQDITGKVDAAQSSVLNDNTTLKKRLEALERAAVETQKQQLTQSTEQASRINTLSSELTHLTQLSERFKASLDAQQKNLTQQEKTLAELEPTMAQHSKTLTKLQTDVSQQIDSQHTQLQQLASKLQEQQPQLAQIEQLNSKLNTLSSQTTALQKHTSNTDDITRLQQDILILRSELDNRPAAKATPAATPAPSLADFDAYRAQTNRTISALQEQIRNLQKSTP